MFEDQFIHSDQILPGTREPEILELTADPYPDKRRIKVLFRLSSFNSPPNLSVTLTNEAGVKLVHAKIVNIFNTDNEITLHLPANMNQPGNFTVELILFSIEEETQDGKDGRTIVLKETNLKSTTCSFDLK